MIEERRTFAVEQSARGGDPWSLFQHHVPGGCNCGKAGCEDTLCILCVSDHSKILIQYAGHNNNVIQE